MDMLPVESNEPELITGQVDNGAAKLFVPTSDQVPPAPLLFVAEMITLVPLSEMPLNWAGGAAAGAAVTFNAIQLLTVSFVTVAVTPAGRETENVPPVNAA